MSTRPNETTPLVSAANDSAATSRSLFSPVRRVYFISCLTAISFAITQTSLIYAFRVMTCDEYYKTHEWHGKGDRCAVPVIEGKTARSIAWMSAATVLCSIVNLFVTGYWSKRFGMKAAMFQQTIWASFRTLCQIYAISIGGAFGVQFITITQAINILGSGGGYQFAANSFVAALVDGEHRTGAFGVVSGFVMLGSALGFVSGGIGYNFFGMLFPFQSAFVLLNLSTITGMLLLPYVDPARAFSDDTPATQSADSKPKQAKSTSFLDPFKLFIPCRRIDSTGKSQWDFNLFLLGIGVFFSVLATGYVSMALQLVGTNTFGFEPGRTGFLQSLTLIVKAIFLSVLFPRIISYGRHRLSNHSATRPTSTSPEADDEPISATTAEASSLLHPPQADPSLSPTTAPHAMQFDLYFLRYSILLDGILTSLVAYSTQGWHLFLAASVLPFASGTGSAAKGVTLDLVEPEQRGDALNAIALIEKLAQVSTIGLFGFIFAILSEAGEPTLVFVVNGAIAFLGFLLLLFVRMPRIAQPSPSDRIE